MLRIKSEVVTNDESRVGERDEDDEDSVTLMPKEQSLHNKA